MATVAPTPEKMAELLASMPQDTPIVMLNMLRYHTSAEYEDGARGLSGEEAYAVYSKAAFPHVQAVGAEVIWYGDVQASLISPDNEQWDTVFLVRYPSIDAFSRMLSSEDYQLVVLHRYAALADSRLIATVQR